MNDYSEIRKLIREMGDTHSSQVMVGEITSCTNTDCTVKIGSLEFSNVKLFSIEAEGELVIKPAVGSMVTVLDLSLGKMRDLMVVKVDKPELFRFKNADMTIEFDGTTGKIDITAGGISLKDLFAAVKDMIDVMSKGVLTPNSTLLVTAPTIGPLLQNFELNYKKILK